MTGDLGPVLIRVLLQTDLPFARWDQNRGRRERGGPTEADPPEKPPSHTRLQRHRMDHHGLRPLLSGPEHVEDSVAAGDG